MEIKATVAPVGFHLAHPELHHYTSLSGLEGILRSRTLWATHFQHLNDRSEVTHLETELTKAVAAAVLPMVNRLRASNPRVLGESRIAGGAAEYSRRHAKTLVSSFYRVAFTGGTTPGMAVPFIASFCSHTGGQDYERDNGLLSQWRGYGEGGGCCIVFDTQGLLDLMLREWEQFYWIGYGVDEVVYATSNIFIPTQYATLVSEFVRTIECGIRQGLGSIETSSTAIVHFLDASTRFKHQGFREEQEIRIVAIPGSQETAVAMSNEDPHWVSNAIKPVHQSAEQNRGRPYLVLFESLDAVLPIKRIIVGPSRQQDGNMRRIAALSDGIRLVRSQTPYVELSRE